MAAQVLRQEERQENVHGIELNLLFKTYCLLHYAQHFLQRGLSDVLDQQVHVGGLPGAHIVVVGPELIRCMRTRTCRKIFAPSHDQRKLRSCFCKLCIVHQGTRSRVFRLLGEIDDTMMNIGDTISRMQETRIRQAGSGSHSTSAQYN